MMKYAGDQHTYLRKRKGRNYDCYCQETESREDGLYKCSFKRREDYLKKTIAKGQVHTCVFIKEEYDRVIDDFFRKDEEEDKKEEEVTWNEILTKVAILVGRRNLSIESGSSNEMQCLIATSIKYGQQFPEAELQSICSKFSADTVRNTVISTAVEVNKLQFKKFSALAFVGISCDEGSTRGIHDLDFVMENPLSDLVSYPCFTTVMKGGKAVDYTEHLARGINFLRINKIPIASLTIDGNKAQIKALSFEWRDSLRWRYIDTNDFIKHILVNHCLCHRINNSYKAAYKKSTSLKTIVDHLRDLSRQCRNHPEDVLDVCPSVQLTRWVVDYDICSFVLNHSQRITRFTPVNVDELKLLHRVLSILKSLTNIFEDPKTPHFRAFRIIENALNALEELAEHIDFAQEVHDQLNSYTLGSKTAGLWMLSYVLTPGGRNDFSLRINKSTMPPRPDYSQLFNAGKLKEIDDIDNVINAAVSSVEIEPTPPTNDTTDIRTILRQAQQPEMEAGPDEEEEEEIVETNPSPLILGPAQSYLSMILDNWGIAPLSKNLTIQKFNSFISQPIDMFEDQEMMNGDYFWPNIKGTDAAWKVICEIAMRLHATPCSEASCERTISTQRIVLTARRMSSKNNY